MGSSAAPMGRPDEENGPTSAAPPALATSSMHEQYGGLLRTVFEVLFGPIQYPADRATRIRELADDGVVIYVARAHSTTLALYFNWALHRLGLPLARFVGGINLLLWQPVTRLWKLLRRRAAPVSEAWQRRYGDAAPSRSESLLADHVLRGEAAFLFLREEPDDGPRRQHDYLRALVAAQRVMARPIYLVPHAVVTMSQGGIHRLSWRDRLFGVRRRRRPAAPGLAMMILPHSHPHRAVVRVGDPLNLRELCAAFADASDEHLARRAKHELDRRIANEERVVAGPPLPSPDELARHVLRDPNLRQVIAAEAAKAGKGEAQLDRQARRYLNEIAARYHAPTVNAFAGAMSIVFSRIYDGVVIDEPGLARVVEVARQGPVVYCPSHRSHVDYLALSTMVWLNGYAPPHIAAGANLSFFPLGTLFRRSGAFFLRRTFKDNRLYGEVFRAYLAELLRRGTSLEFFIEGTRSRTGKVLMPRLGLLNMVVAAWRAGVRDDVWFAPASIDYERIIEAGAHEREVRGGEKRPEDIGALLKTTRVLRSRYGRIHLQFAAPISLKQIAEQRGLPQSADPQYDDAWRRETERLGYRILHHVATCSSVTPTAVAATTLLAHQGRGIADGRFVERSLELTDFLDSVLARLSSALLDPQGRAAALREAVQSLVDQGIVTVDRAGRGDSEPIYRVLEERRIQLEYYKNALMNYVAPAALVCRALRRRDFAVTAYADLVADTRVLSRLFKREFLYRADANFETYVDETLATLAVRGVLDVHEDGRIEVREREPVRLLAGLVDALVESYWITAATLAELKQFPMWHKELATLTLERARRAFLEGQLSRPEAANAPVIDNALQWYAQAGVIEAVQEGKRRSLKLSAAYAGDGLARLVADLAAFL